MKQKEQTITGFFLGLTTIDFQYVVDPFPQENSKNKAQAFYMALGGPAVNAAAAFSHLGGKAQTFSVVGKHAMSPFLNHEFEKYKLNLNDLAPDHPHYPTLASVWTSQTNGNRTIVTNQRVIPPLDLTILHDAFRLIPQIILVDGFYMEAAIELAKWGKKQGIPIVMDGGSWKDRTEELLSFVDIVICSNDFQVPDPKENLFHYLRRKGVRQIAVTRGEKPIEYMDGEDSGAIPVREMQAVDTLGAGDIFHGAFCYYYALNSHFTESLALASVVAGESCRYLGAKTWMHQNV
ncbi:MAG: sugar kinase [Bacteroidetes bacterium]|nr:sugar kinase [Bacteroidota bacterium]